MADERLIVRAAPGPAGPAVVDGVDEERIRLLVERFYGAARRDDLLGPVFAAAVPDERWPQHLETIRAFWSSALLRTGGYGGRPLPAHLGLPGLEDAHFLRWLALFQEAARQTFGPEAASAVVERAERMANSFRLAIRMQRGESTAWLGPISAPEAGPPRAGDA
ncbi:group III truncated hemoglobin [Chthonobacter rhizosphaerae]|uniref:group III truncated hemoglobin n=1 Tax=Chthonobacter rhizosphaerae TaxID=2735553 RepID=UPI001FEC540B|nr:group III truncated hemoglobin [Chthonobacter rhizosphaerae]